ncbi:HIG1 domain family member 2A, mitochondrial [Parasteatoda tepidariorum]|uniref:HIG1 domain family member 2A n=1 Tax=Parasteatoda tepidariorum TaxID=114398 RepID=A0A2L2YC02_PARTP|nr:HIG1 domain family member 2A, mitochondrial [Parasteatoda tepidariorum]
MASNKFPSEADSSEKDRLEWLQTVEDLNEIRRSQGGGMRERMLSKIKENPLVPIGLVATTVALSCGLYAMKSGNKRRSQLMMRARIGAQGFTVAALIMGILVASGTKKT